MSTPIPVEIDTARTKKLVLEIAKLLDAHLGHEAGAPLVERRLEIFVAAHVVYRIAFGQGGGGFSDSDLEQLSAIARLITPGVLQGLNDQRSRL